jgi:hypothetical protein
MALLREDRQRHCRGARVASRREHAEQQQARFFPMPLHRALGDAVPLGDLGDRETAEELQADHRRELGVERGQLVERFGDLRERRDQKLRFM